MKYDYNKDGKVSPSDIVLILTVWRDCGHWDSVLNEWILTESDIERIIRELYVPGS